VELRECDVLDHGFGWIADDRLGRCSHALASGGRAWLVDALDAPWLDDRVRRLGEPAGVIQLLDRHARDCAAIAARQGVPHHVVPRERIGPFESIPLVDRRFWRESALWWPEERILVCADALGTVGYFLASRDRLGVHPLLRLAPPRRLGSLDPLHVLCGHGAGIHDDATQALHEALATARHRLPSAWWSAIARR
jgi:hypothetical protein